MSGICRKRRMRVLFGFALKEENGLFGGFLLTGLDESNISIREVWIAGRVCDEFRLGRGAETCRQPGGKPSEAVVRRSPSSDVSAPSPCP